MTTRRESMAPSIVPSTTARHTIQLLIAGDSRMDCQLLTGAFARQRSMFDICCATSHPEVLSKMESSHPDIILVSENLADGSLSGYQALSDLRRNYPDTGIIMLLRSDRQDTVIEAFRAGVNGVFCRTEPIEALRKCVHAVFHGQTWVSSKQLRSVLEAFSAIPPKNSASTQPKVLLTRRENDVARLVVEGHTNRDVAERLGIAEHTVSNYLVRIYEKLGISTRVELVLCLLSSGDA